MARVLDETVLCADMVLGVGVQAAPGAGARVGGAGSPSSTQLAPFFDGTNNPSSRACASRSASLQKKKGGGEPELHTVLPSYDMKQGEKVASWTLFFGGRGRCWEKRGREKGAILAFLAPGGAAV